MHTSKYELTVRVMLSLGDGLGGGQGGGEGELNINLKTV